MNNTIVKVTGGVIAFTYLSIGLFHGFDVYHDVVAYNKKEGSSERRFNPLLCALLGVIIWPFRVKKVKWGGSATLPNC